MAAWFKSTGCPVVIAANKCDKLKKSELGPNLQLIREPWICRRIPAYILFSAEKGTGREELLRCILELE
jgi:GTP-binding protein